MIPIRLIKENFNFLTKFIMLPISYDPNSILQDDIGIVEYSNAMSTFKFGSTYKSTSINRYVNTITALIELVKYSHSVVLDIGCSDGLASYQLTKELIYAKYYLTDLNTRVFYERINNSVYYYDEVGNCILFRNRNFVIYPQELKTKVRKLLFGNRLSVNINKFQHKSIIDFINPIYKDVYKNVAFMKFDMFDKWIHENLDLVIFANILNKAYFNDDQIIKALSNVLQYCNENAFIVIIDNRENREESSSIFKFNEKRLKLVLEIGLGSDIQELVLTNFT
jgi:hypothetical protein